MKDLLENYANFKHFYVLNEWNQFWGGVFSMLNETRKSFFFCFSSIGANKLTNGIKYVSFKTLFSFC